MKCYDFWYDGLKLSDFGFMICSFDSGGIDTISNGSEITFNQVSVLNGAKQELTSVQYDDCITATIQICKNLCNGDNLEVSVEEMRNIMAWLNRKGFHKFKLVDDEYSNIYLEASFNVSKVEIGGKICGFELEMTTNRPFSLMEPVEMIIENDVPGKVHAFFSKSDEEGYIYTDMEITIKDAGDLDIYSITEDRHMIVNNCVSGEVITANYPIIQTSFDSHKIQNDFNWVFYRVSTSFKNKENEFTASLPCSIKIKYSPIVKIGI